MLSVEVVIVAEEICVYLCHWALWTSIVSIVKQSPLTNRYGELCGWGSQPSWLYLCIFFRRRIPCHHSHLARVQSRWSSGLQLLHLVLIFILDRPVLMFGITTTLSVLFILSRLLDLCRSPVRQSKTKHFNLQRACSAVLRSLSFWIHCTQSV